MLKKVLWTFRSSTSTFIYNVENHC